MEGGGGGVHGRRGLVQPIPFARKIFRHKRKFLGISKSRLKTVFGLPASKAMELGQKFLIPQKGVFMATLVQKFIESQKGIFTGSGAGER